MKCEKLPGCYPSVPGLFLRFNVKRMSKSVRTRGLDFVSSLTSAWNAFSEEHSAGRKRKCLDHWHLSAGDRAYIGMRHRSSTCSMQVEANSKKMDHDGSHPLSTMHQPLQTHCHPIATNCLPKCQGTEVGCTNASLGPIALHRTTRTITVGENAGATRPCAAPLSALMLRVRGNMLTPG